MYAGLGGYAASLTLPCLFPSLPVLFVSSPLVGSTSMLFFVATQNLVGVLSTPATCTRNYANYSVTE